MKILFMCVANSARSQLAEGLAKALFKPSVEVESAGSNPASVNPYAVRVLQEQGIDIRSHRSKSVDEIAPAFLKDLDYVITLCAEEVCPVILSSARKLHWPFADPAGKDGNDEEQLMRFRSTAAEIRRRLEDFAREQGLSP